MPFRWLKAKRYEIACPKCGGAMRQEEKDTSSGSDMRSYRCDRCKQSHIVDHGTALWKVLSDANPSEE